MRDPDGHVKIKGDLVERQLTKPLEKEHFLFSACCKRIQADNQIIDFEFTSSDLITSPALPFVTYPSEWTDAQLFDSARLTLDLSIQIQKDGFELKDASAWNIIFRGTSPVFCDHLSFQKINTRQWLAFGQFVRHFIFPLRVARRRILHGAEIFRLFRDGLSDIEFIALTRWSRFLSGEWLLALGPLFGRGQADSVGSSKLPAESSYHERLFTLLEFLLGSFKPKVSKFSPWSDYKSNRNHYTSASSKLKLETVGKWLDQCKPNWVVDLGCNTGEFSVLACSKGAKVIALDSDHDSVQYLYKSMPDNENLHLVWADLSDLVGGRGWASEEIIGLNDRISNCADTLMMLAIIHHLAISEGIPLEEIARLASKWSKRYLILEIIGVKDPMALELCRSRGRDVLFYSAERQLAAFSPYFTILSRVKLDSTDREIIFYERC